MEGPAQAQALMTSKWSSIHFLFYEDTDDRKTMKNTSKRPRDYMEVIDLTEAKNNSNDFSNMNLNQEYTFWLNGKFIISNLIEQEDCNSTVVACWKVGWSSWIIVLTGPSALRKYQILVAVAYSIVFVKLDTLDLSKATIPKILKVLFKGIKATAFSNHDSLRYEVIK